MEQQSFDKLIKNSLEKLEVPFNADHWQQMEALLHNLPVGNETAIDAHFDSLVKDKIGEMNVPLVATAWAGIEAGLAQGELADAHFDASISDKIANIEGTAAANWEQIEQNLTIEEGADLQFDTEVYSKLKNLHPNYQPNTWQRLLAKLNAGVTLREKLYRYKLMETTLIILLLLQFYQYFPTNSTANKIINNPSHQEIFEQPLINPIPVLPKEPSAKPAINNSSKQIIKSKPNQPLVAENQSIIEVNSSNPIIQDTDNELIGNSIPIIRNYAASASLFKLNPTIGQRSGLSISVSEMNHHLTLHTAIGNGLINTVPSLTPNFVESQYITPLGCKECKFSKIPARVRLGLVANVAMNNAYISGGQILDINALNQKGFGYGSGFSLGFKYGRWEIETGLNYSAKQYDPNIVDTPNGDLKRTHFQTVHLQTLHLPANLRYNYAVLGKGKWHLYTQTGVALNVVLRAEYDLAEVSSISRSSVNDITAYRLSQIDYNNGFLAGDGFKSNRYLSISMGAGVERYISPAWSIFFQPDFHFHFSGNRIGPTEDRINTLAISFGARKSL